MEVTSASRGNNWLFHSASNNFSVAGDSQVSNFELLLDLPTASACCAVEVDENPPPEPSQTDPTTDTVTASEQNSQKDVSQSNSDEDDDRLADSVASELAVIQTPLPKQIEKDTEKAQDESSSQLKIATDNPAISADKSDTPPVNATTPTINPSQQVQVKQDKAGDDEAASKEPAPIDIDSALPKTEIEAIDAQQTGLNRDANKKVIKEDNKGTEDSATLQSETPIRLTEKNESSEKGAQEPIDQLKNEPSEPVTVDKDRSNDSDDRPARWYEQDSSQKIGEATAKEIANADADSQDGTRGSVASEITSSANESLATNAVAESSQADTLASDIPNGVIQAADATLSATTSATTLATGSGLAASEVAALGSIDSESAISGIRPGFTTEQKLAHKTTGIPGNNLESSQTGQQVDISRAEKVRLAQRVARSFSRVGPTGGSVQLKLHPPELGSLAVNIKIEGKSMSAKLTTESQAAREVIMESLPQLRTRLAEQGYDVVQFTVDVASESATTDNQSSTGQSAGQSGAGQGGQSGGSSESSQRSIPGTDLRRSNYLRRQMDAASQVARPTLGSFSSRSIDVQA